MDYKIIIDVNSVIWNIADYEINQHEYFKLKDDIASFISMIEIEKPFILIRSELINEMISGFPFDRMPENFWDFGNLVYSFLGNISESRRIEYESNTTLISSIPNVISPHYNINTQQEIKSILNHIYQHREIPCIYCTFKYLWQENPSLQVIYSNNTLNCRTILYSDEETSSNFFLEFKRVFEHNPKHHENREIGDYESPLSCYNGKDIILPQHYLDYGILVGKRYYNYDTENKVYVVFFRTRENIYHGHDEHRRYRIPNPVLKHFNK